MASLRERMAAKGVVIVAGVAVPPPTVNNDLPLASPPAPKHSVPKSEKLEIQFGDWVHLVRYHNSIIEHNPVVEITKSIQHRLWIAYNICPTAQNAKESVKLLHS